MSDSEDYSSDESGREQDVKEVKEKVEDDQPTDSALVCRMYRSVYPKQNDQVAVQVKNIDDRAAYVQLLEYNNVEGMILVSEMSKRRIRSSIHNLMRVGKREVVTVLRVDEAKGHIDLSKRRVQAGEIKKCQEKYNKSKTVHSILRQVADTCKVPLVKLYEQFGWDLYDKFGHAYDAFIAIVTGNTTILEPYTLREDVLKALLKNINQRLTPEPFKIRAEIELTCFSTEGIDTIKEALRAGEAVGTPEQPVKITLIAPPMYVLNTVTMHKEKGITALEDAISAITKVAQAKEGTIQVTKQPTSVSERDEVMMNQLMERLANPTLQEGSEEEDADAAE